MEDAGAKERPAPSSAPPCVSRRHSCESPTVRPSHHERQPHLRETQTSERLEKRVAAPARTRVFHRGGNEVTLTLMGRPRIDLAKLYDEHKAEVFGFLLRFLRDRALAEDVLQES